MATGLIEVVDPGHRKVAAVGQEPGTGAGLIAGHGFYALVTVRRGDTTTSVLSDTGLSADAMVTNADRLGLDLSAFEPPRSRRKPGAGQRTASRTDVFVAEV